jgi:hypothetical protein
MRNRVVVVRRVEDAKRYMDSSDGGLQRRSARQPACPFSAMSRPWMMLGQVVVSKMGMPSVLQA